MGNLLQMSITSGQDTDSRQFTLAANSHLLTGETYDANGNRTSGSADGFTSVSYNILNFPETVTAGGWTINYLYSAWNIKKCKKDKMKWLALIIIFVLFPLNAISQDIIVTGEVIDVKDSFTLNDSFLCKQYYFLTENNDTLIINYRYPAIVKWGKHRIIESITIIKDYQRQLSNHFPWKISDKYTLILDKVNVKSIPYSEYSYYAHNASFRDDKDSEFEEINNNTPYCQSGNYDYGGYVDINCSLYEIVALPASQEDSIENHKHLHKKGSVLIDLGKDTYLSFYMDVDYYKSYFYTDDHNISIKYSFYSTKTRSYDNIIFERENDLQDDLNNLSEVVDNESRNALSRKGIKDGLFLRIDDFFEEKESDSICILRGYGKDSSMINRIMDSAILLLDYVQ